MIHVTGNFRDETFFQQEHSKSPFANCTRGSKQTRIFGRAQRKKRKKKTQQSGQPSK